MLARTTSRGCSRGHDVAYRADFLVALNKVNPDIAVNIEHEDVEMGSLAGLSFAAGTLLGDVAWASEGRSEAMRLRAADLTGLGTVSRLKDDWEILLSACPPHAAVGAQLPDRARDAGH